MKTEKLLVGLLYLTMLARPVLAQDAFADELRDWGVSPTSRIRVAPYTSPTPTTIPGAQTITTRELEALLAPGKPSLPILLDVAAGEGHVTLPGALWVPGMGRGTNFVDPLQASLIGLLDKLTQRDKNRALVFFCVNARCWLSHNAALRATVAGYSQVYWYRGGIEAWKAAGLPLVRISDPASAPAHDPSVPAVAKPS